MSDPDVPKILFKSGPDAEVITIALPELLDYTIQQSVLIKGKISAPETVFIFPGVIVTTEDQAFYFTAGDLPMLESRGGADDASLAFHEGAGDYSVSVEQLQVYDGLETVHAKDALVSNIQPGVFSGFLLRDTTGKLYYLPHGAFATLTSFTEATAGA